MTHNIDFRETTNTHKQNRHKKTSLQNLQQQPQNLLQLEKPKTTNTQLTAKKTRPTQKKRKIDTKNSNNT